MIKRRLLALLLLAALAGGGIAAGFAASSNTAPTVPLLLKSCSESGYQARCGTLMVPENRLTGGGRRIPVRVVVIRASTSTREADPIVYFSGGPGSSAVDSISQELPLFALNSTRDVVFIEQRGTGESNVTCPGFPGPNLANKFAIRQAVESCLKHLRVDPRFYTTAMFADDVYQVLSDLHYSKVNLVGGSYGATAEQVFLSRHPARVRTMTLLSGSLLNVPLFERVPAAAEQALDRVFGECRADAACHRAFPDPAGDWAKVLASIRRTPWTVPAAQSPTHERLVLDDTWIASAMHQMLFDASSQLDIPLVVHLLASANNPVPVLLTIVKAIPPAAASSGGNQLMAWEIRCNEAWARDNPAQLLGNHDFEYSSDLADARWREYVCSLLPRSTAALGKDQLSRSSVPVLALNGAEDPQDPPTNVAAAKELWRNSLELVVPNQGHNIDYTAWGQCAMGITEQFIESASTSHLATGCLSSLARPSFALSLSAL